MSVHVPRPIFDIWRPPTTLSWVTTSSSNSKHQGTPPSATCRGSPTHPSFWQCGPSILPSSSTKPRAVLGILPPVPPVLTTTLQTRPHRKCQVMAILPFPLFRPHHLSRLACLIPEPCSDCTWGAWWPQAWALEHDSLGLNPGPANCELCELGLFPSFAISQGLCEMGIIILQMVIRKVK